MSDQPGAGRLILAVLIFGMISCDRAGPVVTTGVSLELAHHRASILSDINYRLRFDIPEASDEPVDGIVTISFVLADDSSELQLDFREAADKIRSVLTNGHTSAYRFENEHLVIPKSELVVGANRFVIEFVAGSSSLNRNPDYLYTLFVPDRARTAFPLFDQPDLKATYDLTLNIPADWNAMSNAPIKSVENDGNRAEYTFLRSDLISSYLFSFVAGKFSSITQERNGRSMTMFHRETDMEKVQRNVDTIFDLHAAAIDWLETYSGIAYPYQKFSFALIPTFQYGGMEHVGAIQYRANSLFLEEAPSDRELLGRASLIAHETAHMWFGNLVTMKWFNDVWTKEVFANFMAAKIINPSFPDINHDLNFLVRHHPRAYAVDRTAGANPIRQELANLNEAGQMYGAIIYNKAPIMMRQLEELVGADQFQQGLQEYLKKFAWANATWPDLIQILDARSEKDLQAWSDVWVNTAGRPEIRLESELSIEGETSTYLVQFDETGQRRVWPQKFEVMVPAPGGAYREKVTSSSARTRMRSMDLDSMSQVIFNSDGFGYGLFPATIESLGDWNHLSELEKGSELVNLFENLLLGSKIDVQAYFLALQKIIPVETNQLILNLALGQLSSIYWKFLPVPKRQEYAVELERILWQAMLEQKESSKKKMYFDAFADVAISPSQVQTIYEIWSGSLAFEKLLLSENDLIDLSQILAIKMPERAKEIVAAQLASTQNPDSKRRMDFLAPSLSPEREERDRFFYSLADEANRQVESWVLDALQNLHHPLRTQDSEQYLLPSLQLLQDIQVTGDIFFPKLWLDTSFSNYRSSTAVNMVKTFLEERPEYNHQLRMKILQSTDILFRANVISRADEAE